MAEIAELIKTGGPAFGLAYMFLIYLNKKDQREHEVHKATAEAIKDNTAVIAGMKAFLESELKKKPNTKNTVDKN